MHNKSLNKRKEHTFTQRTLLHFLFIISTKKTGKEIGTKDKTICNGEGNHIAQAHEHSFEVDLGIQGRVL